MSRPEPVAEMSPARILHLKFGRSEPHPHDLCRACGFPFVGKREWKGNGQSYDTHYDHGKCLVVDSNGRPLDYAMDPATYPSVGNGYVSLRDLVARKASVARSAPAPEIITRRTVKGRRMPRKVWKVHTTTPKHGPSTDIAEGHMHVPLDTAPESVWVRRHEMAHVKWSPSVPPTAVDPLREHILACEDARVNLLLRQCGFDTETHRDNTAATVAAFADALGPLGAALAQIAVTGTSEEAAARAAALPLLNTTQREAVQAALRAIRSKPEAYAVTKEAAEILYRTFGAVPAGASAPEHCGHGAPKPGDCGDEDGPDTDDATGAPSGVYPPDIVTKIRGRLRSPFDDSRPTIPWGRMETLRAGLTVPLARTVGRGKWRSADSGAVPRRMERWAADKGVFATRGRARGGTVLIDASGSMGLSSDAIDAVLRTAPAATVAMYSGGIPNGKSGQLVILAQRGRRVAKIPRRGGMNTVDGPALRWLATQKSPRIWVSDGEVTGVDDRQCHGQIQEAAAICKTFGILRTRELSNVPRVLRGRK